VRRRYLLAGIALVVLSSACSGGTARRTDPAAAENALAKATIDLRAGHTALATREFRGVVKLDPGNKFAWFDLGVGVGKAGHVSEADRDYLRAIAIDPGFEPALFNYGYDQYGSKHYAVATPFLRRATEAIPNDAGAHLYLGLSLAMQAASNPALGIEATDELELALKLNPAFRKELQQSILGFVPTPTGSPTSTTTQPVTAP
jgi:Tfp pilus assembly protein PilF